MAEITKFQTDWFGFHFTNLKNEAANSGTRQATCSALTQPKISDKFLASWNSYSIPVKICLDLLHHTVSITITKKFTDDLTWRISIRNTKDEQVSWWDPDPDDRVVIPLCEAWQNVCRDRNDHLMLRLEISAVNAARCFIMYHYFGKDVGCAVCNGKTNFTTALAESIKKYTDNSEKFEGEQFKNDDDTDFLVKSDNSEFWVHMDIVCGQSPVFKEMFQVDMMEKATKIAKIPNFEPEIVKMFLEILYTRSKMIDVMLDNRAVVSMYSIAHQYGVHDIVKLSLLRLTEATIEPELFYAVIDLAKVHDLQDLMEHCISCAKKYDANFWEEPAFEELVSKNPKLAVKLMGIAMKGAAA